jgi:peptide/nickel transport system substrate-binding protein
MKKKSTAMILLAFMLVISVIGSACSNTGANNKNGEQVTNDANNTADVSNNQPNDTATNAQDNGGSTDGSVKQGGTLRLVLGGDPTIIGYNPGIRSINDYMVSNTALETLARYNVNSELEPLLADSWAADAAAKTITITLKSGITFSDGSEFNSEAVRWNLEEYRLAKKPIFNEKDTQSIEAVDNATVKITLHTWDIGLLDAILLIPMTSQKAFEEHGKEWAEQNPVGTGPFVMEEWNRSVKISFKKNENYWQEGMPYLDRVEWHIIADPTTASASLQAGEVDALYNTSSQIANELKGNFNVLQLENANGAAGPTIYIAADNPKSPWANVKVRQALSYAIDREALANTLTFGYGIATNQYSIPGTWSYNGNVKASYDPDKAKQLLTEAGYADGFETELTMDNIPDNTQLYTAVQAYLAEIGIKVKLNPKDAAAFREITGPEGKWEGLIGYLFRVDADPSSNMIRNLATFGTNTKSTADVAEFDELLRESRGAADANAKQDYAHQLQLMAFEQHALAVPLYVTPPTSVTGQHVHDTGLVGTYLINWTPEKAWLEKK